MQKGGQRSVLRTFVLSSLSMGDRPVKLVLRSFNLHEPSFRGHFCVSMGNFSSRIGQPAFIVRL